MFEKLKEIVWKIAGDNTLELDEDTSVIDDLEFASLEIFNFVAAIEAVFKIKITDRELQTLDTLGDIVNLVAEKLK